MAAISTRSQYVNWTLSNILWTVNLDSKCNSKKNAFENNLNKILAILFKPQWVNHQEDFVIPLAMQRDRQTDWVKPIYTQPTTLLVLGTVDGFVYFMCFICHVIRSVFVMSFFHELITILSIKVGMSTNTIWNCRKSHSKCHEMKAIKSKKVIQNHWKPEMLKRKH